MKYIFSLTTIPDKFENIYHTIDSLLNQSITPYKIYIHIPTSYTLRFHGSSVSEEKIQNFIEKYNKYDNIFLNFCEFDYGPGTKLLGLLLNNEFDLSEDNTFICLVDDDLIYKSNMLEIFDKNNNFSSISSFYSYQVFQVNVAQGADCIFIPPSKLNLFLKYFDIFKHNLFILFHDDIYISYYFYLLNLKIEKIGNETIYFNTDNYTHALHLLTGKYERQYLNYSIYHILENYHYHSFFTFLKPNNIFYKGKHINSYLSQ